ncbi:MAG TPA: PEGA domain-containing protein [Kofleriaceae bacterium]|nr:PEGA domain-containing protein [Kofleriaceae bacterium]
MRAPAASIHVPVLAALAMLAVLGPAAPARADAVEDAARVHLDRGVAAFRARDYARARRELTAASELVPDKPNPHRWLALTEIQLGDCRAALVHIDGFLSRVPAEDERVAELVRLRELCQRTGALRVESTPPEAALRIDGALVGATPYRALSLHAGKHVLVAEKPGFSAQSREIALAPGGELDVRFTLSPARAPLTRRWWFWTAVGGVALTATAAIVYAASDRDPTPLPPIDCDPTGCRPGAP